MRFSGLCAGALVASGIGQLIFPDAPFYICLMVVGGAAVFGYLIGAIAEKSHDPL